MRMMRFYAAFKGVNLDEATDSKDRFDEVRKRAEAKLSGKSIDAIDFEDLGLDVETA